MIGFLLFLATIISGQTWPAPVPPVAPAPLQYGTIAGTSAADLFWPDPTKVSTVNGIVVGDRIVLPTQIANLTANSSDKYILSGGGTLKVLYTTGGIVSHLRYAGLGASGHVYVRTDDTTATGDLNGPPPVINAPGANGAGRFTADTVNVAITPVTVTNSYRVLETDSGVSVTGITINGVTGTGIARDGFRFREAINATISNFSLVHSTTPSAGTDLPQGIAIYNGSNISIHDGFISGFKMIQEYNADGSAKYVNGDGIATEGDVTSALIERVTSQDNTDAGFDLKGTVTINDTISLRNKRSYRFWDNVEAGTITADTFGSSAVWLDYGAHVHIQKLIAKNAGDEPIIILDGGTTITIDECEIDAPNAVVFSRSDGSGNTAHYGPGCSL